MCRKILTHGIFGECQCQTLIYRANKMSSLGCPIKYEYTQRSFLSGCLPWLPEFMFLGSLVVCSKQSKQSLLYGGSFGYLWVINNLSLNKNSC